MAAAAEAVQFHPPPRVTGDQKRDQVAMMNWIWSFFNSAVTNGGFVQSADALTTEQIQDVVGAAAVAGTGITVTYDDVANTLTIASTITQYTDAMAVTAVGDTGASGVYTPTLTNVTNLDGSTAFQCQYMRIGGVVTVSGKVSVNPTAGGAVRLGISLPIPSDIGAQEDCAGTAFASGIAGQGAAIRGDAANNRAELVFIAVDVTDQPMYFSFTYRII